MSYQYQFGTFWISTPYLQDKMAELLGISRSQYSSLL
jgi:hypothetical protein